MPSYHSLSSLQKPAGTIPPPPFFPLGAKLMLQMSGAFSCTLCLARASDHQFFPFLSPFYPLFLSFYNWCHLCTLPLLWPRMSVSLRVGASTQAWRSSFQGCHSGDSPLSPNLGGQRSLSACVQWNCNNWRDSCCQTTTPRAQHK